MLLEFNLGSAVLQYMRGKEKKSLFCKFPRTWPLHDVQRSCCLYSGPLGLSNLTPNFIMLKETFWGSQKGSGRAGILGMWVLPSRVMPSPRTPCGHTPFMSSSLLPVSTEITQAGSPSRNNRFRPRRESPGELGKEEVVKFLKRGVCCPETYSRQPQVGGGPGNISQG